MKKYGITQEEFLSQLEYQGGRCACCGKVLLISKDHTNPDAAVVDHCHDSNELRGIICHACNVGIGKLGDTQESVERAVDYLSRRAWRNPNQLELPLVF